ncbi:MAG TPA: hypothetical protein VLU46_08155 [Thermoanaerobaculia bacterium]|nr:hypothetical protein [Thermoanaerobaculia bacterium]
MRPRILLLFVAIALLYTLHGMLPGRVLVPMDIPRDDLAWKHDPAVRVRVSNSLLSDVALQFVPWDREAVRQLHGGAFPWRNRYAADGAPLFANPQTALLSPFTWPRLLFGLHGWAFTVFLKLLVGAAGMYWLARTLAAAHGEAFVSAAVFAYCGFTATLALHPHTNVFVILPALCAAAIRSRPLAVIALAALATAGGHPETLFIGIVSIAVFLAWNRRARASVVAGAGAGFLLLAVQIVPFAILMWNSHARAARAAEIPTYFRWPSLVSLVLPGFLGSPLRDELDLTAALATGENFVSRSVVYIGAVVLVAIVIAWRQLPPVLRRGLIIGTAGLIIAVAGVRTGWIAADWFVVPFALFASLAAGPALAIAAQSGKRAIAIVLIAAGVALLIGGALPSIAPDLLQRVAMRGIAYLQQKGHLHQAPSVYAQRLATYLAAAKWTALRRAAIPGFCWIVFAIGIIRRRAPMVYASAIAELVAFGYGFIPSIRVDEIASQPAFVATIDRRFFVASAPEAFPANLGTLYEVRQVDAYDVLTSEVYTKTLQAAGYDVFLHAFTRAPNGLAGVRYWIDERGVSEIANAQLPAPARKGPPEGFVAGAVISTLAVLFALIQCARGIRNPQPHRARAALDEAPAAPAAAASVDEAPRR